MKSFKKILLIFIAAFLLVLPISGKVVNVEVNAEEAKKVKVYIFEAGGCHWCEQEKQYLQGLDSYGVKFEIVTKELYVDNVNWAHGADYDLGKKVATAFNEIGFEQAQYNGTPLVIISDLYAAATYSEDLEQYIDKAYTEGDKDVVGCYANGGTNCLPGAKEIKEEGISPDTICLIIMIVFVVGTAVFVILSRRSTKENSDFEIERYVNDADGEEGISVDEEEKESKKQEKTEKKSKKATKNNSSTKINKTSKPKNKQNKQKNK